jgi:translocation and assembly module TamB
MNLVAGGTLDLEKRPGGPLTAVGNLELVRGFYSFQGRRFDVERDSAVRFQGRTPIDPALNVTATRTISGVDASVHVGGMMRDPTIDLSSRPALDDADVLSLIVFGQSVNDLGRGERTALGERAASMAAGMVAAPVADSIARALNLDMVEIQAPTDSSAPVVALGSQVGTRLYLGVRQEIGRGDSSLVSIEYRIASALRLVTSIALGVADRHLGNHKERSGVDFIYMVRY